MGGNTLSQTTAQAPPLAKPPARSGMPALIEVFPRQRVLRLPPNGDEVGRDWFAAGGEGDPLISRRHLVFRMHAGVMSVRDLRSNNGISVNGQDVRDEEVRIDDGSVLRVGRSVLVYRAHFAGSETPDDRKDIVGPFGLRTFWSRLLQLKKNKADRVLIEGESGTGKELATRKVIGELRPGKRAGSINVAALNAGTFESQLFGHVRGAFTGADKASDGYFRRFTGGAVFFDEFGDLALDGQAKLLRALQENEVVPVGGTDPVSFELLIVAATNRPLDQMVAAGTFRHDLLARFPERLRLPPLRERREDILAIAQHLAAKRQEPYDLAQMEPAAIERLLMHPFPANVRELEAVIQAVAGLDPRPAFRLWAVNEVLGRLELARPVLTRQQAEAAVQRHGSERAAHEALGVSRRQLRSALGKVDRDPDDPPEAGSRSKPASKNSR